MTGVKKDSGEIGNGRGGGRSQYTLEGKTEGVRGTGTYRAE